MITAIAATRPERTAAPDSVADPGAGPGVFALADYLALFRYEGPTTPGILASELVTVADGGPAAG
ncbi:hypothetical protein [Corynebacterium sphenisci]|uniref:hypothetical protein n=1 Tax=Corynebacterium sphenisci TaxID=191493 RepID=UPI0026DEE502|nr:hypothetical protein [Corynebacterium sphenisci]MDO5731857.1 hypothetical protein [Corynebacterium sphenisci]